MCIMVRVGINEDTVIDSAELNDKKALLLSFSTIADNQLSLFEQLSATEVSDAETATTIRIFPFKVPDKKDLTERQKQDRVIGDIRDTRNILLHFLLNFYPKNEVVLDTYKGCGLTKDTPVADFMKKHLSQAFLDKVWLNISTEFIRMAKPLFGREEYRFRLKLRRQSKEKHFATFPNKFLESRPFIEPMTVPKEESRVKFDAWEIKEGLDNPDPAPVSTADPVDGQDNGTTADNVLADTEEMFSPGLEAFDPGGDANI